ncbi:GIN domain-containing protein [Aquimarina macrocephali]|uniref:GIN domain-containing protein n=1 Tax=Aquimarina macrocephali TaxID=666563 RepID=UPI000554FE84|nr:DUF2807 domain-containing protein [Aquimarina macrocephali]
MKKLMLIVALLSFSISIFAQKKPKIKGNRIINEITKDISETFNTVEIDDELEVILNQSDQSGYYLKTDENLIDIVQFKVKDSILKIYTTNRIVRSRKLEISLNVKEIEHIILKNDAKVKSNKKLISEKLYISGYDSSYLDLNIKADDVRVTLYDKVRGKIKIKSENTTIIMNGKTDLKAYVVTDKIKVAMTKAAELNMDGDTDYASFDVKDSSKLKAKKMKTSSTDLNTYNSADAYVYAKRNLELYAQGKSIVYVYGNPELDVKTLTDKTKIIKK